MKRRPLLVTTLSICGVAAHAQPLDNPPSTPGNPVANVYSPTFAVVQWQRSTDDRGAVAGYEVLRDEVSLGTFDALSYVDRDLRPGRGYNYVILAIDSAGQRSLRATVRAVTPDALPLPPSGVRSAVYSRTAAELFWDRSAVFGQRYEVKRDGVVVATTDGTGYFDETLTAARPYLYEVIALNRQGERSAPVRLFVDTSGEGAGPGPVAGPAAPTGLRAAVYSATAGEIFWERPARSGLSYEVRRDGVLLTSTDGTSWFDDALAGGTSYTYEVVAIDPAGGRSAASTITVHRSDPRTPEGAPAGGFAVVTNAAGGTGGIEFYSPDLATIDANRQMVQAGANQGIAFAPDGTLYQNSDAAGAEGLYRIDEAGSAVRIAPFPGKGLSYIDSDREYLASCDVTSDMADLRLFEVVEGAAPPFDSIDIDLTAPCWDTFWDRANDRLYIARTDGVLAIVDEFSADTDANIAVDRTVIPANDLLEPLSTNLHGVSVADGLVLLSDVGDAASVTDGRLFLLRDDGSRDGPTILQGQIGGPTTMLGNPVDVILLNGTAIVAEKGNDLLLTFDDISTLADQNDLTPSYMGTFDKPESIELIEAR